MAALAVAAGPRLAAFPLGNPFQAVTRAVASGLRTAGAVIAVPIKTGVAVAKVATRRESVGDGAKAIGRAIGAVPVSGGRTVLAAGTAGASVAQARVDVGRPPLGSARPEGVALEVLRSY